MPKAKKGNIPQQWCEVSPAENPPAYRYPGEKEIEKQTLCDEFDSKYTKMSNPFGNV